MPSCVASAARAIASPPRTGWSPPITSVAPDSKRAVRRWWSRTSRASSKSVSSSSGVLAPLVTLGAPAIAPPHATQRSALTVGSISRSVHSRNVVWQARERVLGCAHERVRYRASAGRDRPSGRAGTRPSNLLAGVVACPGAGGAALHDALLVHARPELAPGHQPLPNGGLGAAAGDTHPRILGGRCPQDGRCRPLRARSFDASRGDRWRAQPQPGLQPLHASLWGRAGTARRPAHAVGRRLGHAGSLSRAGGASVRCRSAALPARRRAISRGGYPPRAPRRRGY